MMNQPILPPGMSMPISLEQYNQLLAATIQSGFTQEVWEIGAAAIRDWLARNSPDTLGMPITSGYQWKHVFLPQGTLLRTVFNGRNYHAMVEGDELRFEGVGTTPSRFANTAGGVRRNAWKVIWILFPNTATWKLADDLRQRKKARMPIGQRSRPRQPSTGNGARR